jgi:hypothetical protein
LKVWKLSCEDFWKSSRSSSIDCTWVPWKVEQMEIVWNNQEMLQNSDEPPSAFQTRLCILRASFQCWSLYPSWVSF